MAHFSVSNYKVLNTVYSDKKITVLIIAVIKTENYEIEDIVMIN